MRRLRLPRRHRHRDGVERAARGLVHARQVLDGVRLGPGADLVVVATRVRDLEDGRDLAVFEVGARPEGDRGHVGVAHGAFAEGVDAVDWEKKEEEKKKKVSCIDLDIV